MSFGDDALYALAGKGAARALALFEHEEPTQPANLKGDVTTMGLREVGQLYQYYTGMYAYMLQKLAQADLEAEVSDTNKRLYRQQLVLIHQSDQPKYVIDAIIEEDPHLRALSKQELEKRSYRQMLKATVEGVQSKIDLCSREITRRQSEADRTR